MHSQGAKVDLDHLALSSGQASSLPLPVRIGAVSMGGQEYTPEADPVEARLDVSRTTTGYALRIRFEVSLAGPCVRCLEEAHLPLAIDAREVDQASAHDEELRSPYVSEGQLDAGRWANDAVVLAMPAKPVCREDCAGLCPVCGERIDPASPHQHETGGDTRMAKLKEFRFD